VTPARNAGILENAAFAATDAARAGGTRLATDTDTAASCVSDSNISSSA
jgi:hypothetical protein